MDSRIGLVCCTQVILQDISASEARQKDVALTYSMAICSELNGIDKPDWPTINKAIIERWTIRGLHRIKNLAWRYARGEARP